MNVVALASDEKRWYSIALALAIFTIGYNLIEGLVATLFGFQDETLALFGFGLDSFIEMISGIGIVLMVLRLREDPGSNRSMGERKALRITGWSFYTLVVVLVLSSLASLYFGRKPEAALWGLIISIVSIIIMWALLRGKINVGKKLCSDAILADASCTRVCIYMSLILLGSSAIYEWTGFQYADVLGTLGLAWFSFREGRECFEKAASEAHCQCH